MKLKCFLLSLSLILSCTFTACEQKDTPHKVTGIYFDTVVELTAYGEKVPKEALELCEKYELLFSATNKKSELYKLNNHGTLQVSKETLEVVKTALEFSRDSGDLFCIAILPVSKLWDFTAENPRLPSKKSLTAALKSVSSENIIIEGNRITLKNGATIDLGAVAKGYIADKIAELYKEKNLSGIINLGGNILTVGEKPNKEAYKVGVKKPFSEGENLCTLELGEASVATCGVYERYFEINGKIYHHIIDPTTGYPRKSGLYSVTVIDKSSTVADALSTTLFMMGEKEANKYLANRPDTHAVFVRDDGSVSFSKGFENAKIVKVVKQ